MASRVVEVLYQLKDFFTPVAKKVEKAYRDIGKSAEVAEEKVEGTNKAITGSLGRLQTLFTRIKIGAAIAAIGTGAVQAFEGLTRMAEGIRNVVRSGRRLGGTAQDFLDIREAAEALGVNADTVTTQLNRLEKQLSRAAGGSERAQKRFEALGINFREFEKLAPDERIQRLAAAFRAIGDEQEGLARLGALIGGDAGSGIQLLIEEAPEKLADVLATAKETGEVIDDDVVEASERWLRVVTQINQSWDRFIGQLREFSAIGLGGALEFFGLGEGLSELEKAEKTLAARQKAFDSIAEGFDPFGLRDARLEDAGLLLRNAAEEVGRLRLAQQAAIKTAEDYQQTSEDNIQAQEDFNESLSTTSDALAAQTKAVRENLRQQRREYNDARRDQIAVEREFQNLIADITGAGAVDVEDVTLGDVFARLNQAIAASERGDLEDAVKLALDGADYLSLLKEKGTETQGTLGFLATQLANVANQSAAARTELERGDVTGAEAVQEGLVAQTEAIKKIGDDTGRAYAQTLLAAAQDILDRNVLQPRVAAPVGGSDVIRSGSSFSDGTDAGQVIGKRGVK